MIVREEEEETLSQDQEETMGVIGEGGEGEGVKEEKEEGVVPMEEGTVTMMTLDVKQEGMCTL